MSSRMSRRRHRRSTSTGRVDYVTLGVSVLRRPILGDEVLPVLRQAGFALMHSLVGAWAPDFRHEALPVLRRLTFGPVALCFPQRPKEREPG